MTTINAVGNGLSGSTGSGTFVGATSPTLVTPALGAATATSINFGGSTLSTYTASTAWTPVFTFSTPGDLSVSYAVQTGTYVVIGALVYVTFILSFTPTYTTASGNATITGLPFSGADVGFGTTYISSATFPAGSTYIVCQNAGTTLVFKAFGSAVAAQNVTTTSFATGSARNLEGSLVYPR